MPSESLKRCTCIYLISMSSDFLKAGRPMLPTRNGTSVTCGESWVTHFGRTLALRFLHESRPVTRLIAPGLGIIT